MAQESSTFSDELDPRLFDCPGDGFDISENSFDYYFSLNASTDDSLGGSTESAFSTPHTGSSPGDSSIPRSRQAEEILRRSNDHHQPHRVGHYEPLDGGDFSRAMEGISYNSGIPHDAPNNLDTISNPGCDDFLLENDWYLSAQHDTYTFNQDLPANSLYDNRVTELQDVTCGLQDSMMNRFSNHVPWNADDHCVPMLQTPVYSLGGEVDVQRQLFTSSIEDHNIPLLMATYSHIASGNMYTIESPNMSLQEINMQDGQALNASLGLLEAPSGSVRPDALEPNANVGSYTNYPNATPPVQGIVGSPNPVSTSCHGNSPSSIVQLLPTPHSTSAIAETSENRSGSTTVTIKPMRQKNLSILPAPPKSYIGTPHTSNGLAQLPQVYGPQEAQPRRSDRRELTEQGRENASQVRQIGSCVACALGKKKCDTEEICNSCQKTIERATNPKLAAKHICFRPGILDFRQGIPDFFDTKDRRDSLPKRLEGALSTIMIGHRWQTDTTDSVLFPKKVPLTLQVLEHETCVLNAAILWSEGSTRSAVRSYAIDPTMLPTVFDLDEWGRNLLSKDSEIPDFRPKVIDKFLFAYLNTRPLLPSHQLVDLTCRLVSLSTWLYESHPVIFFDNVNNPSIRLFSIDDGRIERRLSDVARSQLLLIAAMGFEATEKEIFSIVDSSMRTLGYNSQNAFILGLCLRRAQLLYRDGFKRYKTFVIDSKIIQKIEKPKAMYDVLATAYSLVYSGSKSPYSNKWKVKDYLGAFGGNKELCRLFVEVIKYDKKFCERNIDDEDDVHLTELFLKKKKGGGPRSKVDME